MLSEEHIGTNARTIGKAPPELQVSSPRWAVCHMAPPISEVGSWAISGIGAASLAKGIGVDSLVAQVPSDADGSDVWLAHHASSFPTRWTPLRVQ